MGDLLRHYGNIIIIGLVIPTSPTPQQYIFKDFSAYSSIACVPSSNIGELEFQTIVTNFTNHRQFPASLSV